jgi:3-methylcrotonyl-CoA carboxylase alpha subunit
VRWFGGKGMHGRPRFKGMRRYCTLTDVPLTQTSPAFSLSLCSPPPPRLVHKESDFIDALASCRRESINAFGDDKVLLERYLSNPRHIEVQIVADTHGNCVHLRERDCSIQRRHQKVLEEAPAPCLSPELAQEMGAAAVKAAKAVGYVGAGTVEFLMEAGTTDFYFCEMNTRLQVEHPVTEMVTGVDLVEWQLRVAAGQELPIKNQEDIKVNGHAIEARIYAENPARDFLPATGTLKHLRAPEGPGIRVETGVREGDEVSVFYDPMISKLITYGEDRDDALDKMISALKRYEVAGMPTNIAFVEKCARHPSFREGGVTTGFLDIYEDDVKVEEGERSTDEAIAMAAVARVTRDREANRDGWNAFTESEVRFNRETGRRGPEK